jgi:hypothetical protein
VKKYSLVACDIADLLNMPAIQVFFLDSVIVLNTVGILLYGIVWLKIRKNIQRIIYIIDFCMFFIDLLIFA